MEELRYPFSTEYLLRKKKALKRQLIEGCNNFIDKKVAILCGPTLSEVKDLLELFLLSYGIRPTFYVSEYNKYYEDAVFENAELNDFKPDIIYIFTSYRSLNVDIKLSQSDDEIKGILESTYDKYRSIWDSLAKKYNSIIIQNNFELPNYRLLGNKDVSDIHGLSNFITKLNCKFYEYASLRKDFYICDINYISADFGLGRWHNENLYALYKCPFDISAMPYVAFNVANIIKSIYGKNKKALVLDLDNTLWGGILAEDGQDNLKIGPETAEGEIYLAFQSYIKKLKDLGIILNVASKNDNDNAIRAINETDGVLKSDDFIHIKANWDNKDSNIKDIAHELNIGLDSMVFLDDSSLERALVKENAKGVEVPTMDAAENYIKTIDRSGFFECTSMTTEDLDKTKQYKENREREEYKSTFKNYDEFLDSMEMKATIAPFESRYFDRISQLSNKSNQFNMTTKRYTIDDIKKIADDKGYITLYGKLVDKFGDNGIVSLAIGKIEGEVLDIELFLMSCRVLKRGMEHAMVDAIVEKCKSLGIKTIKAYYYKTEKNMMVKDLFAEFGFNKIEEKENGDAIWELGDIDGYKKLNRHIVIDAL